jgi:hypothetical protein
MMKIRTLCCIVLFSLLAAGLYAQVVSSHSTYLSTLAFNIPFDGGVFLLLAVGLIYGGKVLCHND